MKSKLKYGIKKILNFLHIHQKSEKKDIFIFSTFRSGSTWLEEIIKNQPGIKFPVSPNKIEFLPNIDSYYQSIRSQPYYIHLSEKEKRILKDYVMKASQGKIIYGRRYINLLSPHHSFITDRSVFRLLRSCYLLDWFKKTFNGHIIYLVRHPIATCLSRKKVWENATNPSYWSFKIEHFLQSDYFRENYLKQDLESFLQEKLSQSTKLEKFVIGWCLENLGLLRRVQKLEGKTDFIFLTYEDLLLNPAKVINYLRDKLQLEDLDKMLAQVNVPSSTVKYSDDKTKDNFKSSTYDKEFLLKKWKKGVSEKEEKEIFEIINHFGINIYKVDSFMPEEKYLLPANFK
ncbi:MAG: sulfotransferase [Bacillota bacterium]